MFDQKIAYQNGEIIHFYTYESGIFMCLGPHEPDRSPFLLPRPDGPSRVFPGGIEYYNFKELKATHGRAVETMIRIDSDGSVVKKIYFSQNGATRLQPEEIL